MKNLTPTAWLVLLLPFISAFPVSNVVASPPTYRKVSSDRPSAYRKVSSDRPSAYRKASSDTSHPHYGLVVIYDEAEGEVYVSHPYYFEHYSQDKISRALKEKYGFNYRYEVIGVYYKRTSAVEVRKQLVEDLNDLRYEVSTLKYSN
jgi:hypothetical protein